MAKNTTTIHDSIGESSTKKSDRRSPIRVREKDLKVRVRSGPGINHPQVSGSYLGEGVHEISKISEGTGSKTGWGLLSDGRGWVALDYVERVRGNRSK